MYRHVEKQSSHMHLLHSYNIHVHVHVYTSTVYFIIRARYINIKELLPLSITPTMF